MTALLALDLGTKCGWAVRKASGEIISGEEELKNRSRFEGGGMRFLRFSQFLDEVYRTTGFTQVAYEEVRRHLGVDAAHAYGAYQGALMRWCEEHGVPYQSVPVDTIKKHACPGGVPRPPRVPKGQPKPKAKPKASKVPIVEAMVKKGHTHLTLDTDNEADALALLYWMIDNASACTPGQRHAPDGPARRRLPVEPVAVVAPTLRRRMR